MVALLSLFLNLLISPLKSTSRLEAENAALRQQLAVLQRKVRGRVQFAIGDRLFFILVYRLFPANRVYGPRKDAEFEAHSMIDGWLESHRGQSKLKTVRDAERK